MTPTRNPSNECFRCHSHSYFCSNDRGKNLYAFWKDHIVALLNKELENSNSDIIINLASNEYISAVDLNQLNARKIDVLFKEKKNGVYKIIGISAKQARGLMVRYIVQNQITEPQHLKEFNVADYSFHKEFSSDDELVFVRG